MHASIVLKGNKAIQLFTHISHPSKYTDQKE